MSKTETAILRVLRLRPEQSFGEQTIERAVRTISPGSKIKSPLLSLVGQGKVAMINNNYIITPKGHESIKEIRPLFQIFRSTK